jgi:SAM-dependent methyltransferase
METSPSAAEYEKRYFRQRQGDEARREVMRRQELRRVRTITGLEGGCVVDVGCGLGELLDLLPDDRWRKYGVEASDVARETCGGKGISFELPEEDGWCDLVVLRGSLQHLDRPIETLFAAHRWLRPGGWLVALATPNAGGPVYRLFQDLPALDPPRNFVVFSDRVLRQCLLNVGFREPAFVYPYLRTPYAAPVRDHVRFLLRMVGARRPFAFWRNMMECYAQK